MLDRPSRRANAPLGQLRTGVLSLRLATPDRESRRSVACAKRPLLPIVRGVDRPTQDVAHEGGDGEREPVRAVYTVGEAGHFLGVVALVNSLRLTGWIDPIYVVDCGFFDWQRELLASEVNLLAAAPNTAPHLLKVIGPLRRPARTMAVIDADIIVTRSLEPLFTRAEDEGKLIAVTDALADRFDPRWGERLGLGALRRRTYVNSGFLVAPLVLGRRIFGELERLQHLIDVRRSMIASGTPADPFFFLDQDVLNALLASSAVADDDVHEVPYGALPHPPFTGIAIVDAEALRLADGNGQQPFGLHHIQRKPWLARAASTAYSELLPRLWLADDLAIRLEPGRVPARFRPGVSGILAARYSEELRRLTRARRALGLRRPSSA